MHLLYLDESGSATDPKVQHFVLAGVSFFERCTHWAEQGLNEVVKDLTTGDIHALELHGSPMHGGRNEWRKMKKDDRRAAIIRCLEIGVAKNDNAHVFAAVIKRTAAGSRDIVELAFEELSRRFDLYLAAMHKNNNTQRGIIIFDKCNTENRLQRLARDFKYTGHTKGQTRNYAEVPLFLDSRASRLIQLADLIAYSILKAYEQGDSTYFDVFKHRIHAAQGVRHGLFECI